MRQSKVYQRMLVLCCGCHISIKGVVEDCGAEFSKLLIRVGCPIRSDVEMALTTEMRNGLRDDFLGHVSIGNPFAYFAARMNMCN